MLSNIYSRHGVVCIRRMLVMDMLDTFVGDLKQTSYDRWNSLNSNAKIFIANE